MELGKAKLMKTGLNALHQAVHPGARRGVCLTPLLLPAAGVGGGGGGGEVRFGDANVIGQFEHVLGLSWAPACGRPPGAPALLAVQHKKHVTVWQLRLGGGGAGAAAAAAAAAAAPERCDTTLLCAQTCELSEPWPLLPQGCVWHPALDVLAVLTRRDASVLFQVRGGGGRRWRRRQLRVRPPGPGGRPARRRRPLRLLDQGRRPAGGGGGRRPALVRVGRRPARACCRAPSAPCSTWAAACAPWRPRPGRRSPWRRSCPWTSCAGSAAGAAVFEAPAQDPPSPHAADGAAAADSSRRSFLETACSSLASSGPVDLTHLLARHRRSDPSPLLHLQRRDAAAAAAAAAAGAGQDSSHLILVTYERKVTTSRRVSIPGILVPDVVAFDPRGATVAVASNACSMVLVYCVAASSAVPSVQQISLQKSERPKGACFLSDRLLLLMVGRQKSCAADNAAFLPSSSASNTDKYALRMVVKDLVHGGGGDGDPAAAAAMVAATAASCASPSSAFFPRAESPARLHQERIRRHSEHAPRDERLGQGIKDLVLPGGGAVGAGGGGGGAAVPRGGAGAGWWRRCASRRPPAAPPWRTLTAAARTPPATPTSLRFDASDNKPPPLSGGHATAAAAPPPAWDKGVAAAARERGLEQLCMAEIRDYAQNGKKAVAAATAGATPYPSALEPPYVNITCQDSRRRREDFPGVPYMSRSKRQAGSAALDALILPGRLLCLRGLVRGKGLHLMESAKRPRLFSRATSQRVEMVVKEQRQLSENVFFDERRPVLLCEGKLRLSALHDLFNLTTVEMSSGTYGRVFVLLLLLLLVLCGPLWIVLVADAGGFVPLTFKPRDELTVRNGRRKSPFLSPGSPETPSPPAPHPRPGLPPAPAPMASSPGPPGPAPMASSPRPARHAGPGPGPLARPPPPPTPPLPPPRLPTRHRWTPPT
ncbi:WD repeat and coiled-coil-containing protein [Merluccius polli]|uniref:WD repeat and coiled-coil-containing protein n=1 Tax=Merluccius polli TaxID=89951 RepID=A0AA47P0N5_MERPO|nr:WD repeat and coiled-coil-containing protein [Merluccius polli]